GARTASRTGCPAAHSPYMPRLAASPRDVRASPRPDHPAAAAPPTKGLGCEACSANDMDDHICRSCQDQLQTLTTSKAQSQAAYPTLGACPFSKALRNVASASRRISCSQTKITVYPHFRRYAARRLSLPRLFWSILVS